MRELGVHASGVGFIASLSLLWKMDWFWPASRSSDNYRPIQIVVPALFAGVPTNPESSEE